MGREYSAGDSPAPVVVMLAIFRLLFATQHGFGIRPTRRERGREKVMPRNLPGDHRWLTRWPGGAGRHRKIPEKSPSYQRGEAPLRAVLLNFRICCLAMASYSHYESM
jgi:hypothetical protein